VIREHPKRIFLKPVILASEDMRKKLLISEKENLFLINTFFWAQRLMKKEMRKIRKNFFFLSMFAQHGFFQKVFLLLTEF